MALRVFLGYDSREVAAYHVASHSIIARCKEPLAIYPVKLDQVPLWRERHPMQSTDFAFSRFLVPWLCEYRGQALFLDADVLVRCNVRELFNLADPLKAVQVVKHDYVPKTAKKFLDQDQSIYKRKNWSSVILFNNVMCQSLTPTYVNHTEGLTLHRFEWLDDHLIGELPLEYNHLVGEYNPNPSAKIVHYTLGGPWFSQYYDCEFSQEWLRERREAGI